MIKNMIKISGIITAVTKPNALSVKCLWNHHGDIEKVLFESKSFSLLILIWDNDCKNRESNKTGIFKQK